LTKGIPKRIYPFIFLVTWITGNIKTGKINKWNRMGWERYKKRKRRSSRLAVSTFNRFKQKEKVS
jgi:hypothetical protein